MPAKKTTPRRAARSPSPTPPPERARSARRRGPPAANGVEPIRERIIRAAAEVYREHGYEQSGMTDIAGRLGITAPALYWYFRSKEAILVAFLEHTIRDLVDCVRRGIRSERPAERLREFVRAYVAWQLQQQDIAAAYERIYALGHLRNSLPPRQRGRIKALEREFYGVCRDILLDGIRTGEFRRVDVPAVAFALIGMVEHLIAWFRPSGRLSVNRIADLYADLALGMVSPPAGG